MNEGKRGPAQRLGTRRGSSECPLSDSPKWTSPGAESRLRSASVGAFGAPLLEIAKKADQSTGPRTPYRLCGSRRGVTTIAGWRADASAGAGRRSSAQPHSAEVQIQHKGGGQVVAVGVGYALSCAFPLIGVRTHLTRLDSQASRSITESPHPFLLPAAQLRAPVGMDVVDD